MKKLIDYIVLTSLYKSDLTKYVLEMSESGFVLFGSPFMDVKEYCQAMVKYEESE